MKLLNQDIENGQIIEVTVKNWLNKVTTYVGYFYEPSSKDSWRCDFCLTSTKDSDDYIEYFLIKRVIKVEVLK